MRDHQKILIVDDELNFTKILSAFLTQRGYEVAVAHSGEAAVEVVQVFCPDLILLDLGLPDLSGDLAALRIRSESKGRPIPIIAVTGHSDPLSETTARSVGCVDYVVKPFDPNELCARIERLLEGALR